MMASPIPHRSAAPWSDGGQALYGFAAVLVLAVLPAQDGGPAGLYPFLRDEMGFSEDDFAALEAGELVRVEPATADNHELALFAAIRVDVSASFFEERLDSVPLFRRGPAAPEGGYFSEPPRVSDLEGLHFPRADLEALRDCEVGNCPVKLPAAAIRRFRAEIDWSAPDALDAASRLVRGFLVDYAETYTAGGDTALPAYADKPEPLHVAEGFDTLFEHAPLLRRYLPDLYEYLKAFPADGQRPGVRNFMLWAREDLGLKPVVTLIHGVRFPHHGDGPPLPVLASKQIYASHYYQARLGITAFVEAEGDGEPKGYLLYSLRSRFDGPLTGLGRLIAKTRQESGVSADLRRVRERLESAYRSARASNADEN